MDDLVRQAERYIREKQLLDFDSGFSVVTGVSGGADSVCLLLILCALAKDAKSSIHAVHVNHQLRGDAADEDQVFVEALCRKLDIPLTVYKEDVKGYAAENGLSFEDAGRQIRYMRFSDLAKKRNAKIAVAHHMDDNAETILFHLLRGADLKGFSGMRPESMINGCPVIRPLLFAKREQIEAFLDAQGQDYCTDETNELAAYTRNRIRHIILREMKQINPKAAEHICRTAELAGAADDLISQRAAELFAAAKADESGGEGIALAIQTLEKEHPLIRDKVLYQTITQLAGASKDISRIHVEDAGKMLAMPAGKRIILPKGIMVVRKNDHLVFKKLPAEENEECGQTQEYCQPVPSDLQAGTAVGLSLPDGRKITFELVTADAEKRNDLSKKNQYTKAFDYDRISGSLFLRTRRAGDEITLGYGTKSIRRYMIDEKIPKDERDHTVLLTDEKDVLWIIGYRIGECYKISDSTKTILKVTVSEAAER